MSEKTFDSGTPHVVLPIVSAKTGSLDQVAAPEDTSLEELHGALSADPNYMHDFPSAQPTASGAVENSDKF